MDRGAIGFGSAPFWFAGVCAVSAVVPALAGPPPLVPLDVSFPLEAQRTARVRVHGRHAELIGDWHDIGVFHGRSKQKCIFDCYGWNWVLNLPDNGGCLEMRLYAGQGFHDPYCADDVGGYDAGATTWSSIHADFTWEKTDRCVIFFLLGPEKDFESCPDPDADGTIGELEGVVLDFGTVPGTTHGYYRTYTDFSAHAVPWPAGVGSHVLILSNGFDPVTGDIVLAKGPTQFMQWGTPDATPVPPPGALGTQTRHSLDDIDPTDFDFEPAKECVVFTADCPFPDGKAIAYGQPGGCVADFDHDGFVTGDDYDGYVAAFVAGLATADTNHDGFVTGDDFDAYVVAFVAGC